MLAIVLGLLVCQHMSASWSSRLPLEVYELTPVTVNSATATVGHSRNAANDAAAADAAVGGTHKLSYLKRKNLEYATVHAKALNAAAAATATTDGVTAPTAVPTEPATAANAAVTSGSDIATEMALEHEQQQQQQHEQLQLDHRRSRQLLHLLKQQQQQHYYAHDSLHLQKLQPKHEHNNKDVRILYQVGESEDDLPICVPNAVCSKIDLYETPWIERQCRCPEVNHVSNIIVHHHHHQSSALNNNKEALDKYTSYLEKKKLLQHQQLLGHVDNYVDNKIEHAEHISQLMQKLGAVHAEELHLYPSDYLTHDAADNEAIISVEELNNEFPHTPSLRRKTYTHAHMRHSGHLGHKAREIPFIGGCPSGLGIEDGHTIADKTRHYKLCQPVHKLPVCKHFRDYTWTLTTSPEQNVTEQIVHCRCPKNSVTYLTKREPAEDNSSGYTYLFACSPFTRIRCQRKQPCKLFTVRKRQELLDEVNINALCQCPKAHHCPSHHTQSGVIPGESFLEDNIQTYSGYCMAND